MKIISNKACFCHGLIAFVLVLFFPSAHATVTPQVAGDGITPSFFQLLGLGEVNSKSPQHGVNAIEHGDATDGLTFHLPPALLSPSLGIAYNSSKKWDAEMSYGWSLTGILQAEKPLARGHDKNTLLVSGLFSGILKEDDFEYVGERYVLSNASPGYLSADYQDNGDDEDDELTLYSSVGVTYYLSYQPDNLAYRIDEMEDNKGNYVTYTYHDDGRIRWIAYGGNKNNGDPHNIQVSFSYSSNPYLRTSFKGSTQIGDYQRFQYRLTEVTIKTTGGKSGNYTNRYSYVLSYTEYDLVHLLTAVSLKGSSSGTSHILVSYDYSSFDPTISSERSDSGSFSLGLFSSVSESEFSIPVKSVSLQNYGSVDITGDGLDDSISSCTDSDLDGSCDGSSLWDFSTLDRSSSGSFGLAGTGSSFSHNKSGVEYKGFESASFSLTNKQKTTQAMRDLDGDGMADIIIAEGSGNYSIHYSNGGGFDSATTETGPSSWGTIHLDYIYDSSIAAGENVASTKAFLDMNGDGWLDLVDGPSMVVYLHSGERGGGWETTKTAMNLTLTAIQNVEYTVTSFADWDPYIPPFDYISEVKEKSNFYDLNGDGCLDYVNASVTPWLVYLGYCNGNFDKVRSWDAPELFTHHTLEGLPLIEYKTSTGGSSTIGGDPSRLISALLDVDADGLVDWAGGEEYNYVWYKNTGNGFELTSRPLPSWWPDEFTKSESLSSTVTASKKEATGFISTRVTGQIRDLDNDGSLDYVTTSGVTYGNYPPPYLLQKMTLESGASTDITYTSSSNLYPSGGGLSTAPQHMFINKNIVAEISTEDPYTGQSGKTEFIYENGYYVDQIFQGFQNQEVKISLNNSQISETELEYELSSDYSPLLTKKTIKTDGNLTFGNTLARGTPSFSDRFVTTTQYDTFGFKRLPVLKTTTEYGESSGSKSINLDYDWDNHGNLLAFSHDGGGVTTDVYDVSFTYVLNSDGRQDRVIEKSLYGYDPLDNNTYRQFEHIKLYYDDLSWGQLTDGDLTKMETMSGWTHGGESVDSSSLSISYSYGGRGELTKLTHNETGETASYTYTFNDAVISSITNNLSHQSSFDVDSLGRVTSSTDANGVITKVAYDDFSREIETIITNADGKSTTVSKITYNDTSLPQSVMQEFFNGNSTPDSIEYTIFDGLGHSAQEWHQKYDGNYSVVNTLHDAGGNQLQTEHPQTASGFSSVAFLITNPMLVSYYDAFGKTREIIPDQTKGVGPTLVYLDEPWTEVIVDLDGFRKKFTYDAHHRIINVEEGDRSDNLRLTAEYRYNPTHQLAIFTDPNGNYYHYFYDAAGRLRQVSYGDATTTSPIVWYTYTYENGRLKRGENNTGAYWEAEYDGIGRVISQTISDGLPTSTTGTLTCDLEYDTGWIGGLSLTSDSTGTTELTYDSLGRVIQTERTYNSGVLASFSQKYDKIGHIISKTFPSGYTVNPSYSYGWLVRETGGTTLSTDYTIDYTYNSWGLLNTATTSNNLLYRYNYTTPLYPDNIVLTSNGTDTYQRDYTWLDNGLLEGKIVQNGTFSNNFSYQYDLLKQLTTVNSGGSVHESFGYDSAGNLTSMIDTAGTVWTYGKAGIMGQIQDRSSSLSADQFYYDFSGKITSAVINGSTREFYYDGLERLRGVKKDGLWNEVIDYGCDGEIVRRADGDPFTESPSYSYSFGGWENDGSVLIEDYSSLVSSQNNSLIWKMHEYDGNVGVTLDHSGLILGSSQLSAYGEIFSSTKTPWTHEAFHGAKQELANSDLYRMGRRHLFSKDGLWLQPEPLLYSGIPQETLIDPRRLAAYRYGRNNPIVYQDSSGNSPSLFLAYGPHLEHLLFNDDPTMICALEAGGFR